MTEAKFVEDFTRHVLSLCGFVNFADGYPVERYCRETAPLYYREDYQRADGPEVCAEADMDCWE